MADENIGEILAVNLVPDPRLTKIIPGGVNVNQSVLSGGMGVSLEKGVEDSSAYVTPWVDYEYAAGDKICVLIVSSNSLNPPADGMSLDSSTEQLIWFRGASTNYAEVMIVRCSDPTKCRLYAPASGVLTVVKSGVFDMDSWNAMQERNIIYFDGGGLIQASESGYTLPPATISTLGGVIVGDGLTITPQGVLSVMQQELPIATQDTTGVVKIGNGLRAAADGTLSVRLGDNLSFDESGNIDAAGGGQSVDLSDYYNRSETDGKFLTKEVAEATYVKKSEVGGGGGSSGTAATEEWVQENFEPIRKNDPGANSSELRWWVAHGVVHVSFAVRFGSNQTISVGTISSSYAPKYEVNAALTGQSCNGYVQIKTSGQMTAVRTGGTSQASGEYARGCASWGIDD